MNRIFSFLRRWMLPIAIVVGAAGHSVFSVLSPLTPWLLMIILFFTFSGLSPKDIHPHPLHAILIALQLAFALAAFFLLAPFSPQLAGSAALNAITPTAAAAATVTALIGGDIAFLASSTVFSSIFVTAAAPLLLPFMSERSAEIPFFSAMTQIFLEVAPTLLIPLAAAWGVRFLLPSVHALVLKAKTAAYYLWSFGLLILVGTTADGLLKSDGKPFDLALVASVSAVLCLLMFLIGKKTGEKWHRRIAFGQALGQKNIMLGVWLAMQYFDSLAMAGAVFYSVFQNLFNAWQIWRKDRADENIRSRLRLYHERKANRKPPE